ncbi:hypothetical protein M422DRAFT_195971, partial [Sphaerobolus stellatus SS14]
PFEGHEGLVRSVAFFPDGQRVVSGSSDKTIRIWNAETGQLVSAPLEGHEDDIMSVAFSPNDQRVFSRSQSKNIQNWTTDTCILHTSSHVSSSTQQINLNQNAIRKSGWIFNEYQHYLLWIPPSYRVQLWLPAYVTVIGKQMVTLDLSNFMWGESWTKAWKP